MKLTRRQAIAGMTVVTACGLADVADAKKPKLTPKVHPEVKAKPLPFDAGKLPGLSERLLRSHHENNYTGAVRKLNLVRKQLRSLPPDAPGFVVGALKAKELAFANSVTLHELYFGNLGGDGRVKGSVHAALDNWFGDLDLFEKKFRKLGAALGGGSGWVILGYDMHTQGFTLSPSGGHAEGRAASYPLLVLDMYEHSYHMDYGTKAAAYVDAFWSNIKWEEVERRYNKVRSL